MFSVFRNAWKVKDIRNKLLFVLAVLAIYRLGTHILLPGMDYALFEVAKNSTGTQTLYSLISGGGMGTIFALGIGPYITASIIMQLLTVAIPSLEQMQKEGAEGRKKINQISRVLAVVLATVQAAGTVYSFRYLFVYQNLLVYIMATVSMVAGTIFIMWLAELISEKGIGNGSSFIIFSNIIAGLPGGIQMLLTMIKADPVKGTLEALALIAIFLAIVVFVVLVQGGERRIPVQYSKTGRGGIGNTSYIPMKVNIAGVMSIIFAVSILQFPAVLQSFIQNDTLANVANFLSLSSPSGALIYVVLIFVFTFFYTSFAVNPVEMAENMKKSASYIPGIRPGKPTSEYFERTIYRLSWIGATCYAIIAIAPILLQFIFKINVGFGGTTLLITTSVCLELTKQLESQLVMRHYKGFLS